MCANCSMRWPSATTSDPARPGANRTAASKSSAKDSRGVRGRFITLEGPDGAGKSTQAKLLVAAIEKANVRAVLTREPGGTRIGEDIRSVLLGTDSYAMLASTEALLMSAARAQHVGEVVEPALARGEWV